MGDCEMEEKTKQLSIRITDTLREELRKIAESDDRSLNYIIVKALSEYVARNRIMQDNEKP